MYSRKQNVLRITVTQRKVLRKARASMHQLNPQLKEGQLKVGDRLVNDPIGYES